MSELNSSLAVESRRRARFSHSHKHPSAAFVPLALLCLGVAALTISPLFADEPTPADAATQKSVRQKNGVMNTIGDVHEVRNWAGYIVGSDFKDAPKPILSGVSGEWNVASVGTKSKTDVGLAQWVGIGGIVHGDDTLISVGTSGQLSAGYEQYVVKLTTRPGGAKILSDVSVNAGDVIWASISQVAGSEKNWRVQVIDRTSGATYDKLVEYESSKLTAQWVAYTSRVEGAGSQAAPDFKELRMQKCYFQVDGTTFPVDGFPHLVVFSRDAFKGLIYVPSRDVKNASFGVKAYPYTEQFYTQLLKTRTPYKTLD